jgi:uncharacterized protein YpmB
MKSLSEIFNVLMCLTIVIILIYGLIFMTVMCKMQKEEQPIMTLSNEGKVIINGDTTDYYLEETKVYKLKGSVK